MVQKNAADAVKLAATGADTVLTVNTGGQDSFLGLNWNVSGNGSVALGDIADTKVLSGTIAVAAGSKLNLSGGTEIALSGILKNISGTLEKTDGGSLLIKTINGNDALNGTLRNSGQTSSSPVTERLRPTGLSRSMECWMPPWSMQPTA